MGEGKGTRTGREVWGHEEEEEMEEEEEEEMERGRREVEMMLKGTKSKRYSTIVSKRSKRSVSHALSCTSQRKAETRFYRHVTYKSCRSWSLYRCDRV